MFIHAWYCICENFVLILKVELTTFITIVQVIIGSEDLKANHAIKQYVDIVPEKQKYDK